MQTPKTIQDNGEVFDVLERIYSLLHARSHINPPPANSPEEVELRELMKVLVEFRDIHYPEPSTDELQLENGWCLTLHEWIESFEADMRRPG